MSAPLRTHVLLIYQQALIRAALRSLIETWPEIERVTETATIAEALMTLVGQQPELIVLDIDNQADFGLAAISALQSGAGQARIVVLSSECSPVAQRQAIGKGAMGVIAKEKSPEVLHKAIQRILAGELWLDRTAVAQVLSELAVGAPESAGCDTTRIGMLTKRERQVVSLIGEGLKNKQIAIRLAISEPTVRHHLTSIFEKLGVKNRLELVIFAHRFNLPAPDREVRTTR